MEKLYIVLLLTSIALLGLCILIRKKNSFDKRRELAIEFVEKINLYANSNGGDTESYGWLLNRSNRMQNQMGLRGIYEHYIPPYQNYAVKNYPIILNMLPELRKSLEDSLFSGQAGQYVKALQEAIVMHIGSVEDILVKLESEAKNPLIWFREGVRELIALPASILKWLGIINEATAYKIKANFLFKMASGLATLIYLLSSIVSLVVGWKPFVEFILNKLPR